MKWYTIYALVLLGVMAHPLTASAIGQSTRPRRPSVASTNIKIRNLLPYTVKVRTARPVDSKEQLGATFDVPAGKEVWVNSYTAKQVASQQFVPILYIAPVINSNIHAKAVKFVYYWGYAQSRDMAPDDIQLYLSPSDSRMGIRVTSTIDLGSFKLGITSSDMLYNPATGPIMYAPTEAQTTVLGNTWVMESNSADIFTPSEISF